MSELQLAKKTRESRSIVERFEQITLSTGLART